VETLSYHFIFAMVHDRQLVRKSTWDFPGWGTVERLQDLHVPVNVIRLEGARQKKLGQWQATAICGNDITSSCLYVVALSALYAGPYAPLTLAMVAGVLYLYRSIYAEVGTALPLNGGAYNVLLNTTTKAKASVAACLTLLSYIATAVISGNTAMHYAANLWPALNIITATIGVLGLFALLTLLGIRESATVALVIFLLHIGTLSILVLSSVWTVQGDFSTFYMNWEQGTATGMWPALFFGFAVGLLGVSGYESSANFIEEQKEGVFPKTLRNMWLAVALFNPALSLVAMGLLPLADMHMHHNDLLAHMGLLSGGTSLQLLVSMDAVLVLSGAVLTSYIGVTGLVRRMALDRVLPQALLTENPWFRTNHWIIGSFFLLCCSILFISEGHIELLAGVYTLSFLGVMGLFAIGNILLKIKRSELPRDVTASWFAVILGFLSICVGLFGNLKLNPKYVQVFAIYLLVTVAVVAFMFLRVQLLRGFLAVSQNMALKVMEANRHWTQAVRHSIQRINEQTVIFFTKHSALWELNRAALYVLNNEQTNRMKVVHCFQREEEIPAQLAENLKILDRIYPQLRIDLVMVEGKFGPELIERLSRQFGVPKNYMFIGTPGNRFPHRIAELGGVRLIM
jgi:amino acid transporter